ncbi:hypothetical protein ACMD2_08706 [Ananas comosus]|uniref:ATP synthase subunit e, mitochondrial n=1 Tax=Ananas comosus TaxID=4615 RepID=A0A199VAU0_ANACO|nr:hypothetical protein ACMD2_08706 [Ananas comosus]
MAVPGPYSGVSTLAFVARASAFTFGVVYGSIKLSYLRNISYAVNLGISGPLYFPNIFQYGIAESKAKSHQKAEAKGHH